MVAARNLSIPHLLSDCCNCDPNTWTMFRYRPQHEAASGIHRLEKLIAVGMGASQELRDEPAAAGTNDGAHECARWAGNGTKGRSHGG